jgi:hypothetical protein
MEMKSENNYKKVAFDLSWIQLGWSLWFFAIVFIVYVVFRSFGENITININGNYIGEESFLSFIYQPAKIYMLVLGIISVSGFLTFYVKSGITRKNYFLGAALSSVVVTCTLMVLAGIVAAVERSFLPSIESFTFMGSDTSWIVAIVVQTLNILVYFMAGWFIGAGFYRSVVLGMLTIVVAIVFVAISDMLWEHEIKNPLNFFLDFSSQWAFPNFISFTGTILLLTILLTMVRAMTKRIRIKLK